MIIQNLEDSGACRYTGAGNHITDRQIGRGGQIRDRGAAGVCVADQADRLCQTADRVAAIRYIDIAVSQIGATTMGSLKVNWTCSCPRR